MQTYITFEGTLPSWRTKIVVGMLLLLLLFIALTQVGERRAAGVQP